MSPITLDFIRSFDWAHTPLGPMAAWPRSLVSYVRLILDLPTPAILFWGDKQTQIYNDGYAVIMGPRHPRYFGAPYLECWPDTAPIIVPWMRQVMEEGKTIEVARAPFTLTRHGFTEEAYFTFTFSPIRDDDGKIAGIYQPVVETTDLVLRERRAQNFVRLAARNDIAAALRTLESNTADIPAAALWLWNDEAKALALSECVGFGEREGCTTAFEPVRRGLVEAYATNVAANVSLQVAVGPYPEPVRSLFLAPLRRAADQTPMGVMAFALSPRLPFGASYREFLEGITRELTATLTVQRAERAQRELRERDERAQRALNDEREGQARRLSALFEHAPVSIAVLRGPEHVFDVANPRYAALLPGRDLLGKPIREALSDLAGQGVYELLDRVYQTGVPYVGRSLATFLVDQNGKTQERFFDFVYQPMPGPGGRPEGIIVVAFEVTEFVKARRDAEAANRAKDEFFAILGHELRNPLAPIVTALQIMKLRGGPELARERAIIERQVEQITMLVDDLLDVSRITRGKVTLKVEPLDVADVVAKAIEMTSPIIEERGHHLAVDVPRGLAVDADANRLAQVVANLLTNAAKYTEPGGQLGVTASTDGARLRLRVRDTGIGISREMLPRVFEPFAQAPQSIDRAQGGLGLGLTIVANLVKLHRGEVSAESEGPGKGSTFTVTLPLSRSSVSRMRVSAPVVEEPREGTARRVLVVDDNEDAAEMLSTALEMMGYEARAAHDGPEALRTVGEFWPEVAMLDIGLPVMDGYELALRLREAANGRRLRLVAVTGYGQESDRARSRAAGFDAHVVKPVHVDKMTGLIASLMNDAG